MNYTAFMEKISTIYCKESKTTKLRLGESLLCALKTGSDI